MHGRLLKGEKKMIEEILLKRQENGIWIAVIEIGNKQYIIPVTQPLTVSLLDAQEIAQREEA